MAGEFHAAKEITHRADLTRAGSLLPGFSPKNKIPAFFGNS